MGIKSRQHPPINSPSHVNGANPDSQTSTTNPHASSSSDENSNPDMYTWALPLESFVLKNRDMNLSVALLRLYSSILRKFGGAPCDALGRTVTYFQSLFTESPAFHPYVMHLPFGRVPKTEQEGLIVAAALEDELIRIVVQNLLQFFYGDVEGVLRYINECPAKFIPRPQFVIAEAGPRPNNGVEGYNNNHRGGQGLWQNPIRQTSFWQLKQEKDALSVNIARCADWIERKGGLAVPTPVMAMPRVRPPQPPTSSLEDDVNRIEAQMTRLLDLVSKGYDSA